MHSLGNHGILVSAFCVCLFSCALPAKAEVATPYARLHNASRQAANSIAAGSGHTCVRFEDGTVRCWGRNSFGQLGDGSTTDRASPATVERFPDIALSGVLTLAAGLDHTCALKATGRVVCWGDNSRGQLGLGDASIARRVRAATEVDLDSVVAVAAGGFHTCALRADSLVFCWGDNSSGQIGDNTGTRRFAPTGVTTAGNFLLSSVRTIVAGMAHNCALSDNGTVRCWGDNTEGQLGTGDTALRRVAVTVAGDRNSRVTALAAGYSHTCALRTRGELLCWGNNSNGQLGNGTNFRRLAPTPVSGPNGDVVGISAGLLHTCAVASSGSMRCWGFNGSRQLGDATTQDRLGPTPVAPDPFRQHFTGVAAGELHTCGLTVFHTVVCWGDNTSGQLGRGTFTRPSDPGTVSLASNIGATAVTVGVDHSCALRTNGRISCWGRNADGQLGLGTVDGPDEPLPVLIPPSGIPQALDLAAGSNHTCAVLIPGRVRCWGRNTQGQIGDGTVSPERPSPIEVPGLTNITAVAAGSGHSCALTADGRVFCWGSDLNGALGDGGGQTNSSNPVQVAGIVDAIQISAQDQSSCALLSDGTAWCWGSFVGDGNTPLPRTGPTTEFDRVVTVAAGADYWCGLPSNGRPLCRGRNQSGQLGDGTFASRTAPGLVTGISDGVLVEAGGSHTCAVRASGRVSCWGADAQGRLGDGVAGPQPGVPSPTEVVRDDGAAPFPALLSLFGLSAGTGHTCVVQTTGAPFCWGSNSFGELGDGSGVAFRDAAREVPSFRFNLAPTGSLFQGGKRAALAVLANCGEGSQAEIGLTVQQGIVTGEGHATVQCTGRLEAYPVDVRAEDKGPLTPGAAQAEAVITVRSRGQAVESLRWSRTVALAPE